MKWVRVQTLNVETSDVEDQLLFDLKIDETTDAVIRTGVCFGLYGSVGKGDQYPFLLRDGTVIDFGAYEDQSAKRYWSTNITSKPIRVDELLTIVSEVEETFRIAKVVEL